VRPARRRLEVLAALTESDLRQRYGRGSFRFVKWLLDPFAVTGVYLVLVTFVLHRGGVAPGLSLACAVVPFNLVMGSVTGALAAIANRRSIILNMGFDRMLIPAAAVLTETLAFAASFLLIVMMMASYNVTPTVATLWLPVVFAMTVVFAIGLSYPLALFGLWWGDLRIFFVSFVRTLFFIAPGLIPLGTVHGLANDLIRINPLTGLFEAYRAVLLYGHRPAAWQLLIPLGYMVAVCAVFMPLFYREQRQFAKVME
jgi:ABC-type polysaccharide/polyol phosphate export permease